MVAMEHKPRYSAGPSYAKIQLTTRVCVDSSTNKQTDEVRLGRPRLLCFFMLLEGLIISERLGIFVLKGQRRPNQAGD